jgi:hypothetical protein
MSRASSDSADLPVSPPDLPAASSPLPRSRWWQFSLRTLLGVMLLAALLLGWWFQPFVVETRRDDGSLRTRFELRRDWRGRRVSHGVQAWYMRGGARVTKTDYGTPLGDDDFYSLLLNDRDFDSLIWLITETITPESWSGKLSLQIGGGQTVEPDDEDSEGAQR